MPGSNSGTTTDAITILRSRVLKHIPDLDLKLEGVRADLDLAQLIYDLRTGADLTQAELAKLIGTTKSVISRLEDSDYKGHSLGMLRRIAACLGYRIKIEVEKIEKGTKKRVAKRRVSGKAAVKSTKSAGARTGVARVRQVSSKT